MVRASELVPFLGIYGNNLFNIYNKRVEGLVTGPVCNWSQALDGASLNLDAQVQASDAGEDEAATTEAASDEATTESSAA